MPLDIKTIMTMVGEHFGGTAMRTEIGERLKVRGCRLELHGAFIRKAEGMNLEGADLNERGT